jgi:hypothetical protein
MKRMIALTFLVATLISMGSARAHAQATGFKASEGCSVATLHGDYGEVLRGEVLGVGPIVAVGVSTFDGKGHFVAEQNSECQRQCLSRATKRNLCGESQLHRHR